MGRQRRTALAEGRPEVEAYLMALWRKDKLAGQPLRRIGKTLRDSRW